MRPGCRLLSAYSCFLSYDTLECLALNGSSPPARCDAARLFAIVPASVGGRTGVAACIRTLSFLAHRGHQELDMQLKVPSLTTLAIIVFWRHRF